MDAPKELTDVYIGAAVRGAPPDNKPLPVEFANCRPYLRRAFELLPNVRVLIGLGQIGFNAALDVLQAHGVELPRPRPKFGHNVSYHIGPYIVIGTYHPSRQNTNTGKLTRTGSTIKITARSAALGLCCTPRGVTVPSPPNYQLSSTALPHPQL